MQVTDGLATLDHNHLEVLRQLDAAILGWAGKCGAREIAFPPLIAVSALERIDYFVNFPHLGLAAAPLNPARLSQLRSEDGFAPAAISSQLLAGTSHFLPSAACYPVYAHLQGRWLDGPERITTVQRCFRNENRYEGLARLLAFTMREIVTVGSRDDIHQFLAQQKAWISQFAEGAGLALSVRVATDPFFESGGERARMQLLFPVKEEFVHDNTVAVSSANFHRNFFAERWNIRTPDGGYAFSGCVAFGLERWLHALARRYEDDCCRMLEAIQAAARGVGLTPEAASDPLQSRATTRTRVT